MLKYVFDISGKPLVSGTTKASTWMPSNISRRTPAGDMQLGKFPRCSDRNCRNSSLLCSKIPRKAVARASSSRLIALNVRLSKHMVNVVEKSSKGNRAMAVRPSHMIWRDRRASQWFSGMLLMRKGVMDDWEISEALYMAVAVCRLV